jgi:hypothetical protein
MCWGAGLWWHLKKLCNSTLPVTCLWEIKFVVCVWFYYILFMVSEGTGSVVRHECWQWLWSPQLCYLIVHWSCQLWLCHLWLVWVWFAVVQSCGVCWASDSETVCWRVLVLCDILLGVHGFCYDQWVTVVSHVCPQVSGLRASAGGFVWSWVLEMSARGYRLDEQRIRVWLVMVATASIPTLWHVMGRVLWALSLGCEVDLHVILRSRMHGAIPPFPHISWCCHA